MDLQLSILLDPEDVLFACGQEDSPMFYSLDSHNHLHHQDRLEPVSMTAAETPKKHKYKRENLDITQM